MRAILKARTHRILAPIVALFAALAMMLNMGLGAAGASPAAVGTTSDSGVHIGWGVPDVPQARSAVASSRRSRSNRMLEAGADESVREPRRPLCECLTSGSLHGRVEFVERGGHPERALSVLAGFEWLAPEREQVVKPLLDRRRAGQGVGHDAQVRVHDPGSGLDE